MSTENFSTLHAQPDPRLVHSYRYLVCHIGELMLKGGNRGYFEEKLLTNIREKFRHMNVSQVRKLPGRVIIEFANDMPLEILQDKAATIFGIANALPAFSVGPSIEEIEAVIPSALDGLRFASFAVRCVRAEKRFPLTSQQINVRIGGTVYGLTGAKVDLGNPDLTVWIEVLTHQALVGTARIEGPSGLPVGTSGKVMALLSAGIDSPVAAWRMMQRGCEPLLLHFHSVPFTSPASQEKVVELARLLARWHAPLRLAMVPFGDIQQEIVAKTPEPYRVVLYRRLMMRIANALADTVGAEAVVTGDSLAQVASQTMANLGTVEQVSARPVFRPLIGMDKNEIIRTARRLKTYDVSIEPHQDCCTFLEPRRPVTKTRPIDLDRIEASLDLAALVARGVDGVEWQSVTPA